MARFNPCHSSMNPTTIHRLLPTLALIPLLSLSASAGLVRFTAAIDATQETTGSTSTATGSAVMIYDVTANTFDLSVTVNDFAGPLTLSHIHEGASGVAGSPVVNFGTGETNYTRTGDTLTATFANMDYTGDPATLLAGNAYVNYHTDAWPGGEVRGQLIPDPVKLTAIIRPEFEIGAHTPVVSDAYGAAQATYDPATNMITTLVCLYNFTNTLTNSHIHEAAVDASGGVTLGFGGASVYLQNGNTYVQQFGPSAYPGSPVALLSEGAYVNAHSDVYTPGEIRGQLYVLDPTDTGRLGNVSTRGRVGLDDEVLIAGLIVQGENPVRVLLTARGPVLTGFNVGTVLADPLLEVYDAGNHLLFTNDDFGTAPFASLIAASGVSPTETSESAVLLVLPPGAYTGIVSGVGGTEGVALAEAFEVAW